MLTIGLTGGIGSGKSTVAAILGEFGAPILDADKIAHTTYVPGGPAYDAVVAAFGANIVAPDRTIDRKKLGSEIGAPILDADKIAHTTYVPGGPAYDAVVAAFGANIVAPDRTIDRKKLGS